LLVTLALLGEELRFALQPPALDPERCDCALRVAFTIVTPPPAERLLAEEEAGRFRCAVCQQGWIEEPPEEALVAWARWRPTDVPWVRRRRPAAPWLRHGWFRAEGCSCAGLRWLGSPWIAPVVERRARWDRPPPPGELRCDRCGQA